MKKKIFSLLLLLLMFLTSCQVKQNSITPASKATYSAASYSFTDEDYKYAYEVIDEIKDIVEKAQDGEKLIELNNWINSESSKLAYYRQIESVNYYMTGNTDYSDKQDYLYEVALDLYKAQLDIYEPVSKNALREVFYGDQTDEEIERTIESANREKRLLPKYKEKQELQNKAVAINDPEAMKPILVDTVKLNGEIAEIAGSSNYLEYAFNNTYRRGYDYSAASILLKNIGDYVIPLKEEIDNLYYDACSYVTNKDAKEIVKLSDSSYSDFYNVINAYTTKLGGDINSIYNNLLSSKYLFVSSEKTAIQAGWTDYWSHDNTTVMYLGPDYYRCVNTFIHEFGHYLNYEVTNGGVGDFDVAETQSQSNEALFQIYLKNNYNNLSTNGKKILNYDWLKEKLDSVVTCACVYACEEALYKAKNLSVDNVYDICKNALKSYGFNIDIDNSVKYAILAAASSPAYYISYATSGLSSVSMYKMALDNFDDAASTYLKLIKIRDDYSYPEGLIPLGITNALDEDDVAKLCKVSNFR